jgi:TolB-like protein
MMQMGIDLAQEPDFGIVGINIRPAACHVEANEVITRVEPKVMEVLVLLARAKGANITREQLIHQCWEGRVVSDDAITRTLSKARKIGTLTNPPAFRIETRPKVGVRLVSSKQVQNPLSVLNSQTGTPIEPLLIVFPFENLSSDPDMQFFSDGVSEEVLGRIIRGSKLKVLGPASSFQFRGAQKTGAAEALGATHIIDGSVRRAGNRVRINAHLTEAATGAGLWSEQFERDLGDIFALQDEIASGIAQALFAKFTPARLNPIDPAIYDLYLRAREIETNPETLLRSIASLERVTEFAPDFDDAWGRLAALRGFMRLNLPYRDRTVLTAQTHDAIARCYQLNSNNLEANYADYWLSAPFGDFVEQERIVERALSRENTIGNDLALASFHFFNVGRCRRCREVGEASIKVDPSGWGASINHAISLWPSHGADQAISAMHKHVEAFPDDQQAAAYLILMACYSGNWTEVDWMTDPKRLSQFPLRENAGILATATVMRFPTPENKQYLLNAMKLRAQKIGAIDCSTMVMASLIGRAEQAYASIADFPIGPTGSKGEPLGLMGFRTHLLFSPANKQGRNDPRFVPFCARLGLVRYWLETGFWPDCADEVPYDFRAACKAASATQIDRFDRFVTSEPRPPE